MNDLKITRTRASRFVSRTHEFMTKDGNWTNNELDAVLISDEDARTFVTVLQRTDPQKQEYIYDSVSA